MEDKRNTEGVVQEIMGLVDALSVECIAFGIVKMASSAENNVILGDDVKKSRALLQSKLRELVERCSVREPLSDADLRAEYLEDTSFEGECAAFRAGARYAERFYNITNTNKE